MNRKGVTPISVGFIVTGVGLTFMALGIFAPEEGFIYKGIFSSLIIPFLMGLICFLGGIGIFAKYFEMKIKENNSGWIGKKVIVQEKQPVITLFAGAMTEVIALPILFLGLFYPQTGVIYAGIYSEIMLAVIIGALFMLVGIVFLCFGLEALYLKIVYNKLKKDSSLYTTTAKCCFEEFEKENGFWEKQGFPRVEISGKVVYKYMDENGVERIALSLDNYSKDQIEWYKNKNSISIRCFGKRSILIDQAPTEKEEESEEELWEE